MRFAPETGPKSVLPGLVLVQFLLLPVPCLSFSRGATGSSCTRMVPGHVHAHPHDPALSYVTLHTSSTHYLPGYLLTVTVRSSRDFMGFLLQARSAERPGVSFQSRMQGQVQVGPSGMGPGGILLGGSWSLTPPGTHTIRCVSDGDTVTHSDKQLKRNLSFVWRAPDRPMGDIRFYITVVQSYFVYWTGIQSPVLHDGTRNRWRGNSMMQVQIFHEGSIQDQEEEISNANKATTKRPALISDTTAYKTNTTTSRFRTQNKTTPPGFLLKNSKVSTANVKTKASDKYGTNGGGIGTFVRSESLFKDKATQTNTEDIASNRLASIFSAMNESTVFSNLTKDSKANMLPMFNATRPSSLLLNYEQIERKDDTMIRSEDVQTTSPKSYTIWNETKDDTMGESGNNITKTVSSANESAKDNLLQKRPTFSSALSDITSTNYLQNQTAVNPNFDALSKIEINTPTNRVLYRELENVSNESSLNSIKERLLDLNSSLAEENTTIPTSIAKATLSIENMKLVSVSSYMPKITTESNYSTSSSTNNTLNQVVTSTSQHSPRSEVKQTLLTNSSIHPKWSSTSSPILTSKMLNSATKYVISSKFLTNASTTSYQKSPKSPEDAPKHETSSPSSFYDSEFHDKAATPLSKHVSTGLMQNIFFNLSENSTNVHKNTTEGPTSKPTNQSTIIVSTSRHRATTSSNKTRLMQNNMSSLNSESTRSSTTHSTIFAMSTLQDSRSPLQNNSTYNLNKKSTNSSKFTFPISQSTVYSTSFALTSRHKSITSNQALIKHLLQTKHFNPPHSEHVTSLSVLQNASSHQKSTIFKATTASQTSPLYTFLYFATTNVQPRSSTLSNAMPTPDSSEPSLLNSISTHYSTGFLFGSNHRQSPFPFHTSTKLTHQYVKFPYRETSSTAPKDTTPDPKFPVDFTSTILNDSIGLVHKLKPEFKTLSTKVTTNVPTSYIGGRKSNVSITFDQHSRTTSNSLRSKMSTKMSDLQDKDTMRAPEATTSYSSTNLQHKLHFQFPKRVSTMDFAHSNSSLGQKSSLESKDTMTENTKNHTLFDTTNSTDMSLFSSKPSASTNQSTKPTFFVNTVPKDSTVRTTHSTNFDKKLPTSIKDIFIASRSPSNINSTSNLSSETPDNRSSISTKFATLSSTIATNTFQKTSFESIGITTTYQASIHSLITGLTKKPKTNEASKHTTIGPIEPAISNLNQALERTNGPTKEFLSSTQSFKLNSPQILPIFLTVATNFHQKTLETLEMTTIVSTTQSSKESSSLKPSGRISTASDSISLTKFHNKLANGKNTERSIPTDLQSSNFKSDSSISTRQFQTNSSPLTTANYAQLPNLKGSTTEPKTQSSNHSSFYNSNTRSSHVSKGETSTTKKPIDFSFMETSDSNTRLANETKTTRTTAQYSSKGDSSNVFTTLEVTAIAPTTPLTNQMLSSKNARLTPSIVSKSTINGRTTAKKATSFSQSFDYFLNTGTKNSPTMQSKNGLDGKNIPPSSSNANSNQRSAPIYEATTIVPMRKHTLPTTLYQKSSTTLINTTKILPISVFVNSSTKNSHPTFSGFSRMPKFVITSQSQTPSNAHRSANLLKSVTITNNVSTTSNKDNKTFTISPKRFTFQKFSSITGVLKNKTLTVAKFPYLPTPSPISSAPNASPFFTAQTYSPLKPTSSTSSYTIPNKSDPSPLKFKPSAVRQSFLNHITTFKPTLAQKPLIDVALPNHSAKPNPAISRISQNTNQNVKAKVEVMAKLPPNLHPDKGEKYPDIVPRHSAWELGMLLGCSAGLGMVLVVGIRYVHRKACGKRTQVTLHDREREYSRGERGLIHVQECGDLVRVRRIRENSFVLLAEYDILATPGD